MNLAPPTQSERDTAYTLLCSGCGASVGLTEPGKIHPCPACGRARDWCGPIWGVEPALIELAQGMPRWRQ